MRLISAVSQVRLLPPPPIFVQLLQLSRRINSTRRRKESANEISYWREGGLVRDGSHHVGPRGTRTVQCQSPLEGHPFAVAGEPTSAARCMLLQIGRIDLHLLSQWTYAQR